MSFFDKPFMIPYTLCELPFKQSGLIKAGPNGAKIVFHVPFKIPVVRCQVQIVGKGHARRDETISICETKVSVDFTVERRNDFSSLISYSANAK